MPISDGRSEPILPPQYSYHPNILTNFLRNFQKLEITSPPPPVPFWRYCGRLLYMYRFVIIPIPTRGMSAKAAQKPLPVNLTRGKKHSITSPKSRGFCAGSAALCSTFLRCSDAPQVSKPPPPTAARRPVIMLVCSLHALILKNNVHFNVSK